MCAMILFNKKLDTLTVNMCKEDGETFIKKNNALLKQKFLRVRKADFVAAVGKFAQGSTSHVLSREREATGARSVESFTPTITKPRAVAAAALCVCIGLFYICTTDSLSMLLWNSSGALILDWLCAKIVL